MGTARGTAEILDTVALVTVGPVEGALAVDPA